MDEFTGGRLCGNGRSASPDAHESWTCATYDRFGSWLCENSEAPSTALQIVEFSCSLIDVSYENRVKLL